MEQHNFSADRPIWSIEDDLLGRSQFAKSLCNAIAGWKGKDSLVIALHGDWGSGKSSLKNMALTAFKDTLIKAPILVEFNPWEWAGQDKITKSFFEQLALSIGQKNTDKKSKNIAKQFRLYGLYLNSGATLISGLTVAFPYLFLIASMLGFSNIFFDQPWIKTTSSVLFTLTVAFTAFLKWGGKFADQISNIFEEQAGDGELPLIDLKSTLAKELVLMDNSILVIIDDIDRLSSKETRDIFQLVKANADFPNIVYLLLFQRDIVERRLGDESQSGRDYLEKIIQVPFDIPRIEQSRIEKIFFSRLDQILEEDPKILKRFNQTRWGNLYHGGLSPYFKTLRNIYRYLSTLSFHVTLLTGENAFEVNPLDLIAVECLRIFEPEVYKSISLSKTLLTSSYNDQNEREKAIADLEGIFKNAPQERIEDVKTIIKQLFPPIESLFGGYSYGDDYGDIWFKDLRICHPDIFSRYFQFSIPIDDISQSDLEDILFLSNNRDALVQKLNSLKSNNLLKAALNQLDAYKHDIPLENSNDFIPALMDIGDTTDDQSIGFTSFSSHLHLVRIVLWYLRKEDSIEERGNKLLTAFSKTDGLSVMAHILAGEISRREKPDNGNLLLTTDATLEKAKGDFIKKFKSIIKSDPKLLFSNIHLAGLLFRMKNFGEIKTIRKWLGENITTFEDLLVILDRFMSQVSSQTMGDYVGKIKDQIRLDNLNTFFPLENVIELIKNKDRESLNEHQKRVWDALQATLKRKEKGLSDDSWDDY